MASSYANGGTSRMLIAEINNNERKNKSTFVGSFEAEGRVSGFEGFFTPTCLSDTWISF